MQEVREERLAGKAAIITGAARGVGAVIAQRFVDHGARVILSDVRADEGQRQATALGASARFVHADVSEEADWNTLVEQCHQHFGPVDILVNNAAILEIAGLRDTSRAMIERLFRVNQLGPTLGIRAVMDDMISRGSGSIVNIGSADGVSAQDIGLSAYGATKWALRGLTRMVAMELGRHGVRVNCVHSDGGNPMMSAPFLPPGTDPEQAMREHLQQVLRPPRGKPAGDRMQDIAWMVLFLASDESSGCTGADFMVDGGYTAGRCLNWQQNN